MGKTTATRYSLPDGEPTELRPDSDTVLTLKNPFYRETMENFYRRLGTKKSNDESNDLAAEKNTAREALNLFKDRGKGGKARFFLAADRYSRESFVEVDEDAALKKITADIYRRMENSKRWMNPSNEEGAEESSRKSPSPVPQAPPEPEPTAAPTATRKSTRRPKTKSNFSSSKAVAKRKAKKSKGGEPKKAKAGVPAGEAMLVPKDDPAMHAAAVIEKMKRKHPKKPKKGGKPQVMICLGEHLIDTVLAPSLIQPIAGRKRAADEGMPDYFDPTVRPSAPTTERSIFIPGNKVYARWNDRDDPGSYGTWYSGSIVASKLAPIQDAFAYPVPNLLYDIEFADGEETLGLDREDIVIHDQYQTWLRDLEQYYALSVPEEIAQKRLAKNTRVRAKWLDPTDPELHGAWMLGTVHGSKTWEGADRTWRHSYHVVFDNGDEDEDVREVLEVPTYDRLMKEKARERKRPKLSGFEALAEASKISSPIKASPDRRTDELRINGATAKRALFAEKAGEEKEPKASEEGLPSGAAAAKPKTFPAQSARAPPQDQSKPAPRKESKEKEHSSSKGTAESVTKKGAASNESNGKKREASGSDVQPNSKRARKDEEKPLRIKLSLKSKASGEKTSATKAASNASSPARKSPAKRPPSAARKKGEGAESEDAARQREIQLAAESTVLAIMGPEPKSLAKAKTNGASEAASSPIRYGKLSEQEKKDMFFG